MFLSKEKIALLSSCLLALFLLDLYLCGWTPGGTEQGDGLKHFLASPSLSGVTQS